jgi:ABC-2 type transport system ATP-binding protein
MTAIEVNQLTKYWGQTLAVDKINFQVKEGEVFGFLGPNGAGKTTTIKMLVGLSKPTSGSAKVAGYDVVKEPTEVKRRIGVVPEASNLYNELTVYENLRFVSKLYHIGPDKREGKIEEYMETFQIAKYKKRRFGKLSKGLKRRTVLAAALIHDPEIIFLDEPTSGLDIVSARNLRQVISDLAERGVTIFLTTHYIEEAGELCDRIALLVKGNIIEIESPDVLCNRIQDIPLLNIQIETKKKIELKDLKQIPAEDVRIISNKVSIFTNNVHRALSEFIKLAEEKEITIQEVQTVKPQLEDAFIQLTGLSPESMKIEKEGKR